MMTRISLFLTALMFCVASYAGDRVLLVVSSAGTAEDPESGYEFDELTQAWWTFVDNGYEVDIASPAGGEPQSEEQNPRWAFNSRFLEDDTAMHAATHTKILSQVNPADYEAVFVIGGSGAAIDLPTNTHLQSLIRDIYNDNGVVGAVCHGPAAFVNIELDDSHFLQGRSLTAFTNEETALFGDKEGKHWSLEDRIVQVGGQFDGAGVMDVHVVTDGRLITGQNPFSTAQTVEATIRAMGKQPIDRELYTSEKTMQLATYARKHGLEPAQKRLQADPDSYESMFLALLGYYRFKSAQDNVVIQEALTLMTLSQPYFQHDNIDLAMATAHQKLGEKDIAKNVLHSLLERSPDFAPARELLASLEN